MTAKMGLGNIVYIRPVEGQIKDVKLGDNVYEDNEASSDERIVFNYYEKRFAVQYNP